MEVYREITPLKEPDVLVVLDSFNNGFDYPIHNHPEYELNLVAGISGIRLVGDSTERYQDYDLVLLGPYLYHKWDGEDIKEGEYRPYRVITIQFAMDLLEGRLFAKERFYLIRKLLTDSTRGIKFHGATFEAAMRKMISLTEDKGFVNIIEFMELLDLLSKSDETTLLASEGFTPSALSSDNSRIQIVYNYILKNFAAQSIKLSQVAALVNMSDSAFSHFFQKYTNKSFTQFLLDVRIGHTCKLLLSTDETINQIAYQSGFNNIANFNRLFRKNRNYTPVQYRQIHKEKNKFDWTKQITPWQFLPTKPGGAYEVRPEQYATKLTHV